MEKKLQANLFVTIALLITTLLSGCSNGDELSDEDRVRRTLNELETAAESRSLSGMADHISESYKDYEGNDYKRIKQFLQLELIKNQSINIFSDIRELEVIGDSATIELSLAMAGRGVDLSSQESRLRANTYRFSVLMKREENEWKIRSVSWQQGW